MGLPPNIQVFENILGQDPKFISRFKHKGLWVTSEGGSGPEARKKSMKFWNDFIYDPKPKSQIKEDEY